MKGFHHTERFVNDEWKNVEITQQSKIENLEFLDMSNNFNILKTVIKSLPNLKHLKLHSLDQISMEFISLNAKALKSLHVDNFISEEIFNEKLFLTLEEFSYRKIDYCLKTNTKVPKTHFEKLVFK